MSERKPSNLPLILAAIIIPSFLVTLWAAVSLSPSRSTEEPPALTCDTRDCVPGMRPDGGYVETFILPFIERTLEIGVDDPSDTVAVRCGDVKDCASLMPLTGGTCLVPCSLAVRKDGAVTVREWAVYLSPSCDVAGYSELSSYGVTLDDDGGEMKE